MSGFLGLQGKTCEHVVRCIPFSLNFYFRDKLSRMPTFHGQKSFSLLAVSDESAWIRFEIIKFSNPLVSRAINMNAAKGPISHTTSQKHNFALTIFVFEEKTRKVGSNCTAHTHSIVFSHVSNYHNFFICPLYFFWLILWHRNGKNFWLIWALIFCAHFDCTRNIIFRGEKFNAKTGGNY